MSIDTAQKRSGGFQIPGVMMNPFPDGTIGRTDRIQISDIYPGIVVQGPFVPPNQTCWAPAQNGSSSWKSSVHFSSSWKGSSANASSWKKVSDGSSSWVKEKDDSSNWTKENEVTACND